MYGISRRRYPTFAFSKKAYKMIEEEYKYDEDADEDSDEDVATMTWLHYVK